MRVILIISILILPYFAIGQQKPPPPPTRPPTKEEANQVERCVHRNLFSAKQRRAFFPFNEGYSIKLISYNDPEADFNVLPVHQHVLDLKKVREIQSLTIAGTDSLTDILYNVGYAPVRNGQLQIVDPGGKCFNPRNAIIFMDGNNKVMAYVNICFECHQVAYSSDKIKRTDFCREKFDMLKNFFTARGIKIGTVSETQVQTRDCPRQMDSLLNKYVYYTVDSPAEPEGGLEALSGMLMKNIKYPAGNDDYGGRVIVAFVVEPNGKIDGERTIRDPSGKKEIFSRQIFRIIKDIKWKPAFCNGRAVPYMITLPLTIDITE